MKKCCANRDQEIDSICERICPHKSYWVMYVDYAAEKKNNDDSIGTIIDTILAVLIGLCLTMCALAYFDVLTK